MDRRHFILLLLSLGLANALPAGGAQAKDGGDDGGGDDGGGGSDDSDSDGGSDGKDSDDNDSDRDDGDRDDSDDHSSRSDDSSGSGRGSRDDSGVDDNDDRSGSSGRERDQREASEAVKRGEILPLREILKRVDEQGGGRVIAVDLNMQARRPFYTLKVQSGSSVKTMKFEASTGRKLNIFGW